MAMNAIMNKTHHQTKNNPKINPKRILTEQGSTSGQLKKNIKSSNKLFNLNQMKIKEIT